MEGLELKSFEIISSAGTAKSYYMEAINLAYEGRFDEAESKIKEAEEIYRQAHSSHASLIQQEASGNMVVMTLLLTHAEDQMMSAEMCKMMSLELIRLYKKVGAQK